MSYRVESLFYLFFNFSGSIGFFLLLLAEEARIGQITPVTGSVLDYNNCWFQGVANVSLDPRTESFCGDILP